MKRIWVIGLLIIWGCTDYEVELPDYDTKVVIEGVIEPGEFPRVFLTLSSGFFDPVDSSSLEELVLTTARVAVSDGETEEVLTLFRNKDIFPPFYYAGTDLRGEIGKTYTLEVVSRGETYTSTTTIPEPAEFDTLWFERTTNVDTLVNIFGKFSDDPSRENYYRVFTKVFNTDDKYIPVYQSIVGDKFFNGESFTFTILKGTESVTDINNDIYFFEGDTVDIKLCTLDKTHFDFWRTLERELYLAGNPFSSAGNEILSNIEGSKNALGVWGGYGVTYYRIIIK